MGGRASRPRERGEGETPSLPGTYQFLPAPLADGPFGTQHDMHHSVPFAVLPKIYNPPHSARFTPNTILVPRGTRLPFANPLPSTV